MMKWRSVRERDRRRQEEWKGLDPYPGMRAKKVWEAPITASGNKYIIGFIDMLVDVRFPRSFEESKEGDMWWEDFASFAFEVKTVIPSLGEVIRQIRMYQEYTTYTVFCVVSPDSRAADVLRKQGIAFIDATG